MLAQFPCLRTNSGHHSAHWHAATAGAVLLARENGWPRQEIAHVMRGVKQSQGACPTRRRSGAEAANTADSLSRRHWRSVCMLALALLFWGGSARAAMTEAETQGRFAMLATGTAQTTRTMQASHSVICGYYGMQLLHFLNTFCDVYPFTCLPWPGL